jgi:ATP-dependent helicase HrpB
MMVEAEARGVAERVALLAAVASERDLGLSCGPVTFEARRGARSGRDESVRSDLLEAAERFEDASAGGGNAAALERAGVDPGVARGVERARRQLARLCRPDPPGTACDEDVLLGCVLAGFPDRVAKRVRDADLALAGGGSATLAPSSRVREAQLLVAVDAEERMEARGRRIVVRAASAIDPAWLLDFFPDAVRAEREVTWSEARGRVEVVERLRYGEIALDETRGGEATDEEASEAIVRALGVEAVLTAVGREGLERWLSRVALVREAIPAARLPELDGGAIRDAALEAVRGVRSVEGLRRVRLAERLASRLDGEQRGLLERMAPERVRLGGGRSVLVHYERGAAPWIESRLQDFFGMASGPAVAGGRVPTVLHLLAPNGRAVQVTTDLAGFWERTYAAVRKELRRRYPKHAWPEDGRTATPPPAAGRRG